MRELEGIKKPSVVRRLWEGWKRVGKRMGDFQARVLLNVFYYVVFAPFALAVRRWSDPLAIKKGTSKGWQQFTVGKTGTPMERATTQF